MYVGVLNALPKKKPAKTTVIGPQVRTALSQSRLACSAARMLHELLTFSGGVARRTRESDTPPLEDPL